MGILEAFSSTIPSIVGGVIASIPVLYKNHRDEKNKKTDMEQTKIDKMEDLLRSKYDAIHTMKSTAATSALDAVFRCGQIEKDVILLIHKLKFIESDSHRDLEDRNLESQGIRDAVQELASNRIGEMLGLRKYQAIILDSNLNKDMEMYADDFFTLIDENTSIPFETRMVRTIESNKKVNDRLGEILTNHIGA